jgi:Peptidase propeptide and YPEB domain
VRGSIWGKLNRKIKRITGLTRRVFALLFISWLAILPLGASAWAKDGDSGGGSNSGSGSSNSGSGSDSSGGGDDDNSDDDDDSGGGNSGSGSRNSGKYKDQYDARKAVNAGDAISLEEALRKLRLRYPGKVISVNLGDSGNRLMYWFKVKSSDGHVRKVVMDAKTGAIRGLFGFGGS